MYFAGVLAFYEASFSPPADVTRKRPVTNKSAALMTGACFQHLGTRWELYKQPSRLVGRVLVC
jgi:hypothetical protein